jgi:uncharacterized protein DUF4159
LASAITLFRRHRKIVVALAIAFSLAATAAAQRNRRGGFGGGRFQTRLEPNAPYDGAFRFCRIMFPQNPNGDGGGWSVDYPRADINLMYRLSELTAAGVSKDSRGDYNHAVFQLTDPELYKCPFIMMTEVGALSMDAQDAANLRDYLLRGGFLWADDFWGEYAWTVFEHEIGKALPDYQILDIPLAHPLFHMLYQVNEVPQIPSIGSWFSNGGGTSERVDSKVPHARGIFDQHGNMMVLITHNTDFGDAFEREGENRAYFERFAGPGYAFGINALLYAMTH